MSIASRESLAEQFAALHKERQRSWDPEQLRRNIAQRRALVEAFDPRRVVGEGDRIDRFELERADGQALSSDDLLAGGPVLLIFFRFAGCPACNIALPYYDRQLRSEAEAAGVRMIAVSPHLPETGLGAIADRHELGFEVAADRGNALARRLGITFLPLDNSIPPAGDTNWIGALTGTGTHELPQPAIVLIDRDRIVRFVDVSPDWLARTEAPEIIAAFARLRSPAVA
jgi:peroxiredoxin